MEKQINFLYFIALFNLLRKTKYVGNIGAIFDKKQNDKIYKANN